MLRGCTYLGIAVVTLAMACREHESSTKDKELDVQLAQAKARQAEAEAEKAAVEARAHQAVAQTGSSSSTAKALAAGTTGKLQNDRDVAVLAVKTYSYEAFGEWSQAHPGTACPHKLDDLTQYMDTKSIVDPWGHPYRMFCGHSLPAASKGGLAITSDGPDGRQGTSDDIQSW